MGKFLNDSHGAIGKVTEIGRIEVRDWSIDSRDSWVLYLSSGKTSSKSFEQHELSLPDGVSASPAVLALVFWQQVDWEWVSPLRILWGASWQDFCSKVAHRNGQTEYTYKSPMSRMRMCRCFVNTVQSTPLFSPKSGNRMKYFRILYTKIKKSCKKKADSQFNLNRGFSRISGPSVYRVAFVEYHVSYPSTGIPKNSWQKNSFLL